MLRALQDRAGAKLSSRKQLDAHNMSEAGTQVLAYSPLGTG